MNCLTAVFPSAHGDKTTINLLMFFVMAWEIRRRRQIFIQQGLINSHYAVFAKTVIGRLTDATSRQLLYKFIE